MFSQRIMGQMKPEWQFRDEYLENLQSMDDTIYIQNRHKMERILGLRSDDTTATYNFLTKFQDKIFIKILCGQFEPFKHNIYLYDTIYKEIKQIKYVDHLLSRDLIDGKRGYGIDGKFPLKEIKEFKLKWNENWLDIPKKAFGNLYEVHLKSIEAYLSDNKHFIYVYLSGSDGAASFSVKFVFNKNKYVTRIITTNECTNAYDFLDALAEDCE